MLVVILFLHNGKSDFVHWYIMCSKQRLFDLQVCVDSREGLAGLRELAGSVRRLEAKLDQLVVATTTGSHSEGRRQLPDHANHRMGEEGPRCPPPSTLGSNRVLESGGGHPSVALSHELLQVAATPLHVFIIAVAITRFWGRKRGQLATQSSPGAS